MHQPKIAGHAISWASAQHGNRPAVIIHDRTYSFTEVERRSNQLANALTGLGLRPGDRLATLLGNCIESLDSVFGAEKAAQTYVALNARHTLAEHADILNDAEATTLIVGPEFAEFACAMRARVPSLRHIIGVKVADGDLLDYDALLEGASDRFPALPIAPELLVRIAYTSGTTGKSKGVAYSVERWYTRLTNHFYAMEFELGVDDAMLHVGPLTHAAGVYLLPCYLRGARNVIAEKFDAAQVIALVERHRVTQLMLVPTMLKRLLEELDAGAAADLSSLRRIHYGTAPTPLDTVKRAIMRFGPILRQQYGMTEVVQPLSVLYPHDHVVDGPADETARTLSCGRPTINVDIAIHDADGKPVAAGEVGEIAVAHWGIGEVAFWRRPDLEEQSIRNGWYYTGDLGKFDDAGYLYIVGRNKDMIISGGFNVYSREVEDALCSHRAVLDAAVVGIPDREWGELVAAFVVLRPGQTLTTDAFGQYCGELIAGYKKPRVIEFVDELPRNGSGKVLKNELRASYMARHGITQEGITAVYS
ncbi:AMP-binding protein [Paraburkholderia sp. BL10I2N1]|uniref:class I adenylate-forming enzyme family protein n=1 Tax=Paraburkholderia sp. BL10I2N1 TaxID=1938796 RepID=UPI00105F3C5C|nr:AMP-binding protein [Paraburkholderia sp. BL10I2N1]TDN59137.1 acyl-CoA synthetase (AMP-forming)/AMP-acid ligase II [Paraburkholderia sp. BL10I2N1]